MVMRKMSKYWRMTESQNDIIWPFLDQRLRSTAATLQIARARKKNPTSYEKRDISMI